MTSDKTDDDYARALGPRPANDPHVRAFDESEELVAKTRLAARLANYTRQTSRRGGAGPHTGL